MPFNEHFWREKTQIDISQAEFTWAANSRAVENKPVGIEGFIVSLPTSWTLAESNDSRMNKTLLADSNKKMNSLESPDADISFIV